VADKEEILDDVCDGTIVHAVFTRKEDVFAVLARLKEEDLGLSVVVQGLCAEVKALTTKAGLKPHTVNHSLGRWGKRELLPDQDVLGITTMCGHGMVSQNLVTHFVRRIAAGSMTSEDAAQQLAQQCVCGVFNPKRARRLLERMAALCR